ncbi:CorA family divalent cation transporter [Sphingomicrobium arenosum]|uniref:CorA family divalent cation transporter n=1 Tax=Sphingomicrobium arenosum TaxID=2233861 RepID=UPI002240FAE7|nr:CorA family divalent cation transporter [Sphingomicrobium arenosum]
MTDTDAAPDATSPLLFARLLDGQGGARPLDWGEARHAEPAPGELLWIHLCRTHEDVEPWLETRLAVPEPIAEMLIDDGNRPRATREGDTLIAVLRGINFNPDAEPEDMISMQLWTDGRIFVTLRRDPLQTPREVVGLLDRGIGPVDAGALVTELVEHLVARMNRAIVDMNEVIDRFEEADLDNEGDMILSKTSAIRRNCLALKRHMGPQHNALEAIARADLPWFDVEDRREIGETIERLRRYLDDIDVSKESALVLQDELRARALASSERTNSLLTLVASVFLPLGFLTGLLGINVAGMPGTNDSHAFWNVVWICGLLLVLQWGAYMGWRWWTGHRH